MEGVKSPVDITDYGFSESGRDNFIELIAASGNLAKYVGWPVRLGINGKVISFDTDQELNLFVMCLTLGTNVVWKNIDKVGAVG